MESKVKSVGNVSFPSNKLRGLANVLRFFVPETFVYLFRCVKLYFPRKSDPIYVSRGGTHHGRPMVFMDRLAVHTKRRSQ